ncbi:MAG: DUF5989 family protein [Candidatus Sumerlaeia bacterium]
MRQEQSAAAVEQGADDPEDVSLAVEFVWFLRENKKWWLIPMIVLIVVLSLMAVLMVQYGSLMAVLYPLF